MSNYIRTGLLLLLVIALIISGCNSGGGGSKKKKNNKAERDNALVQAVIGTWFTTQNDDGLRGDNTTDTHTDETDGIDVITADNAGNWTISNAEGVFNFPASQVTVDSDTNTVTFRDSDGRGRTILAYSAAADSISGQWQKLAADNVTWYENYETWISVVPCNGVGGPTSYDDFVIVADDCGSLPFDNADIADKSYIFDSATNEEHNFIADGTGVYTNDNGVTTIDFTWSIDSNGYLIIDYDPVVPMAKELFAKYGTDNSTGGFLIKAYREGDNTWPGDFVFDDTPDGRIYQDTLYIRPAWQYTETVGPNTCGDPEGDLWFETEVIIYRSGNNLTLVNFFDNPINATVDNSGAIQGIPSVSFPELGGTTTIASVSLMYTDDNNINGTISYSWTDGATSCSGTNSISMTK